MGYFEDWKELIIHPGKEVLKRKKGFDNARIAMYFMAIAIVSSFVIAFGNGTQLEAMFNISAPAVFAAMFIWCIVDELLLFFCIHYAASALGGKGKLRGLLSVRFDAYLPFAILALAYFVPCAGFTVATLFGLAGLSAWIVVFKYLRLVYKLSVKRALAALFVPLILLEAIVCAVFIAVAFSSLAAGAAANAPVITQTASGNHLYSAMYGGYSFDFPSGWKYIDLANGTSSPLSSLMIRNSIIGIDFMMNAKTNNSALVVFESSESHGSFMRGYGIDTSAAAAEYEVLGKLHGYLLRNVQQTKTGKTTDLFVAGDCAVGYNTTIMTTAKTEEDNTMALKQIGESFRCGSAAVK